MTFVVSLVLVVYVNFYGIMEEKVQNCTKKSSESTQPATGGGGPREWSTREKVLMEGISPEKTQKQQGQNNNTHSQSNTKKFNPNNASMLRYALLLLLIIPLQKQPEAMLAIQIVVQLVMLFVAIVSFIGGDFESVMVGALFVVFEVVFTGFISSLGLTLAVKRDNNSTREYKRGTVPLITLLMLMISVKMIQIMTSVWTEWKRKTRHQKKRKT